MIAHRPAVSTERLLLTPRQTIEKTLVAGIVTHTQLVMGFGVVMGLWVMGSDRSKRLKTLENSEWVMGLWGYGVGPSYGVMDGVMGSDRSNRLKTLEYYVN